MYHPLINFCNKLLFQIIKKNYLFNLKKKFSMQKIIHRKMFDMELIFIYLLRRLSLKKINIKIINLFQIIFIWDLFITLLIFYKKNKGGF